MSPSVLLTTRYSISSPCSTRLRHKFQLAHSILGVLLCPQTHWRHQLLSIVRVQTKTDLSQQCLLILAQFALFKQVLLPSNLPIQRAVLFFRKSSMTELYPNGF